MPELQRTDERPAPGDRVASRQGAVLSVHRSADHSFSKSAHASIRLVAGLGVESDAHLGARVQHRSRVAQDPSQPNLRQVHLLPSELFDELASDGFIVGPGELGENITTRDLELRLLPAGSMLRIGDEALVALTGLRNPCKQIETYRDGLLKAVLDRDASGAVIRKAGVMGVVVLGGEVKPGDSIEVAFPPAPHRPLERI